MCTKLYNNNDENINFSHQSIVNWERYERAHCMLNFGVRAIMPSYVVRIFILSKNCAMNRKSDKERDWES